MNKQTLFGGLRIAMKALAGKFGIILTFSGSGAYTDGKRINLPVLDQIDDQEEVAILARGYIDHEAAHCRFTSFDAGISTWINILEDVRIEGAMAREYPGAGRNLSKLVVQIKQDGESFRATPDNPLAVLQAWALTWGRSTLLGQDLADYEAEMRGYAHDIFGDEFCQKFLSLLNELPGCESTQDVRALVEKIEELIKQFQQQQPPQPEESANDQDDQEDQDQGDGDSNNGADQSGDNQDGNDQSGDQGDSSEDAQGDQGGNNADGQGDQDDQSQGGQRSGKPNSQDQGQPGGKGFTLGPDATNLDIGGIIKDLLNDKGNENYNTDPYAVNIADSVHIEQDDYCYGGGSAQFVIDGEIQRAKRATAQMRAKLSGLLESVRLRRRRRVTSGHRIAGNSCHLIAARTCDNRVFLAQQHRVEDNASVAILFDSSGSMEGRDISMARSAAFAISEALDAITGVETVVGHFPHNNGVRVIKDFGQKAKPKNFAIGSSGGTPLAESILWGGMVLGHRPHEKRKVLIIITDGEVHLDQTREAVKKTTEAGVQVCGIGIGGANPTAWAPQGQAIAVGNINDLPKAMTTLLKTTLVDPALAGN